MVQKKAGESRKSCDEAKAALEGMPGGATVENLMALDHRLRNKCFACFRGARSNDEGLAAEYDSAADDAAKRGQLVQFILDATAGKLKGTNETSVTRTNKNTMRELWLTQNQLAGPYPGLGNASDAAEHVKTSKSRPHKTNTGLRKAGIREFQHFVEFDDKQLKEEEKVAVVNEADMEPEEYQQVKRDMQCVLPDSAAAVAAVDDNRIGAAKRKVESQDGKSKRKKKDVVVVPKKDGDSAEDKTLEEAKNGLDKLTGEVKTLHGRMNREIGDVGIIKKKHGEKGGVGRRPVEVPRSRNVEVARSR